MKRIPEHPNEMTREHYIMQSKFVAEYVATCCPYKAARATGYKGNKPGKRAEEIFKWPGTNALVATELEGYALERQVTKQWMLKQLFETYEAAISAEYPKPQDVLKVLDAIALHTGLNRDLLVDNKLDITIRSFGEGLSGLDGNVQKPSGPPPVLETPEEP